MSFQDLDGQQQSAITQIYERNTLLIAQAGFGKTVVAQSAAQELISDDVLNRVLVLAPPRVVELTWTDEHEKWEHLWQPAIANGSPEERAAIIEDDSNQIVVVTFNVIPWLMENYDISEWFDGLLVDESTKLKDVSGAGFKAIRKHFPKFTWRCAMSATPVHECGTDIYSQMLIVDETVLGTRKDRFLNEYFIQLDYKGYKHGYQPGGLQRLTDKIAPYVFVADTEEYEKQLPALVDKDVYVEMPAEAWEAYDEIATKQITRIDGQKVKAANRGVVQSKLHQICCGAVYVGEKESRQPLWLHEAKFDALEDYVNSHPDTPLAIVYQWKYELEMLRNMFEGECMVLADNAAKARDAWNAGEIQYLLLHPASAGHGLNIQYGGNTLFLLSPFWSADKWDQLMRRFRRRNSPFNTVERITARVRHSVEDDIMCRQDIKADNADRFVNHVRARRESMQ